MKINSSSSRTVALSAMALILSASLLAAPTASASLKDHFQIRAQNTQDSDIRSVAGLEDPNSSTGYYADSRRFFQDGVYAQVTVAKQVDGSTTVLRQNSGSDPSYLASDRLPYSIRVGSDGSIIASILLMKTIDGYNHINISRDAEGGTQVQYIYFSNGSGRAADRKHGPTTINMDGTGKFINLAYSDGNGGSTWAPANTVAGYNEAAGQDWDGSYAKLSDFDTAIPFKPIRS